MSYRIERDERVDTAVRRVALEQVDGALADIHAAAADVETAVHDLRKRCKKVRGLIRLVRPWMGAVYREENTWFRDTARRLSGTRDRQVMGRTFDALCAHYADECATQRFTGVRRRLHEGRGAQAPEPEQAAALLAELRPALERAAGRIRDWPLPAAGFAAVEPGLRLTYRRGRRALAAVESRPSAAAVHEWRKRVKYHWYHARLLVECWRPVMDAWRGEAHLLSEELGDAHDLAVLRHALATDVAGLQSDPRQRELIDLVDRRERELLDAAIARGRRLYAERPRRLGERLRGYWGAWRGERF